MSVIKPVKIESANPEQKKIMEAIKAKLGKVPNIYASLAQSPAALQGLLGLGETLKKGVLTAKEIESIALAVGQDNACEYCLSAHTVIGQMSGLSQQEITEARKHASQDKKLDALIKLAVEINKTKGNPSAKTIEVFRQAGYSDAALVEVIAWVAQNIFTNYFNHINKTEVDFPKAPAIS